MRGRGHKGALHQWAIRVAKALDRSATRVLWAIRAPNVLAYVLALFMKRRAPRRAVLHVSYAVHVPWITTRALRRHGVEADYLSIGRSAHWDRCDYLYDSGRRRYRAFKEAWWVLRVVARYHAVHLHFGMTLTRDGWELPLLRRLGRRIVVHFRGCEARDRDRNMALHPNMNICQQCDYRPHICRRPVIVERTRRALAYADHVLVTTPDMNDFLPHAEHLPFFAPETPPSVDRDTRRDGAVLRVVHATNHPGIEGTAEIADAVSRLRRRGRAVELKVVTGAPHEQVLDAFRQADVAIGKMKMGYYANAQIESMALGVPTITWVRPDLLTPELRSSGFIFCRLSELESTLERLVDDPALLARHRRRARASVLALHDNRRITERLAQIYELPPSGTVSEQAG